MYAVIKTGGKQYKVAAGNLIAVEKLAGQAGDAVSFDQVLLVGGDKEPSIGAPLVAGAAVSGEIVEQRRSDKVLVFKKRRRQNSKRTRGHRQSETLVRITEILTSGKKAKAKPQAEETKSEAPVVAKEDSPPPAEVANETQAETAPEQSAEAAKTND
jgi:large subunit ribosomal protein L21